MVDDVFEKLTCNISTKEHIYQERFAVSLIKSNDVRLSLPKQFKSLTVGNIPLFKSKKLTKINLGIIAF